MIEARKELFELLAAADRSIAELQERLQHTQERADRAETEWAALQKATAVCEAHGYPFGVDPSGEGPEIMCVWCERQRAEKAEQSLMVANSAVNYLSKEVYWARAECDESNTRFNDEWLRAEKAEARVKELENDERQTETDIMSAEGEITAVKRENSRLIERVRELEGTLARITIKLMEVIKGKASE